MFAGPPREIKGPGKVGPQGQGSFHSESQLHRSCKLKIKKNKIKISLHVNNDNNYPSPTVSLGLLYCSSEEYCDCYIRVSRSECSIRVY